MKPEIVLKSNWNGSPCISIKIFDNEKDNERILEFCDKATKKGIKFCFVNGLMSEDSNHTVFNIIIDDEQESLDNIHQEMIDFYKNIL